MALKISLKPHERLILGGAVITNGKSKCDLIVENNVPILRQKDIMSVKEADSPCRRIYFVIQLMYVDDKNLTEHHKTYWKLVKDVTDAAPSTRKLISEISEYVLHNRYYQALKLSRRLIDYEQEAISKVDKAAEGHGGSENQS
ncbi:MAG: flagellar biosynthesis repressor FlbT [Deltaproteobacteria bacterium]|nr:flagellar biosynthesis repressor FlbT [Deltaproteobacteria bacterium]